MALLLTLPFDSPGNYDFPNTIEVIDSNASLADIIAIYKTATNATFFANYNTDINGLWGNGGLTGTAYGGASVVGDKLDLKDWGKLVDYAALNNGDSQQQGCIRIQLAPDFSGIGATHNFISIPKAHGDSKNNIWLSQHHNGQMKVVIIDKDGVVIISQLLPVWQAVQGQLVEFELNWNINDLGGGLGATRLFINGVQSGMTMTGIGIRDSNIGVVRIGSDFNQNGTSNSEFNNVLIFSEVQHVSDYVSDWAVVPETLYDKNDPKIKPVLTTKADAFESYYDKVDKVGNDDVKNVMEVDNQDKYWDGLAWVDSTGYAQSNTKSQSNDNASDLDISLGVDLRPAWYLHSEDGWTTPEIDLSIIGYDFFGPPDIKPSVCEVYGYVIDKTTQDKSNITVNITPTKAQLVNGKNFLMDGQINTIKTNSEGYFEKELIWSSEFTPEMTYLFEFLNADGKSLFKRKVKIPNKVSEEFETLEVII